jgi:hypothetical protein
MMGVLAAWLAGCGDPPGEPCARYAADLPDAYAVCLRQEARAAATASQMLQVCAFAASDAVDACREAWVAQQLWLGSQDADTLLAACGGGDDCALQVLDLRPSSDVLAQATRCDQAGRFADDCRGHAIQRWARTSPSAEAVAQLQAAWTWKDRTWGDWLGYLAACQHTVTCPAEPAVVALECQRTRAGLTDPRRCNR